MPGLRLSEAELSANDGIDPLRGAACATGKRVIVRAPQLPSGYKSAPGVSHEDRFSYLLQGTLDLMFMDEHDEPHGVRLQQGAYFRVPMDTIYWVCNRSQHPAKVIEFSYPGSSATRWDLARSTDLMAHWESPEGFVPVPQQLRVDETRYGIEEAEAFAGGSGNPAGLALQPGEIPSFPVSLHLSTGLTATIAYGPFGSLLVAQRPHGYHSTPHFHPCEQLNYVSRGTIDAFVAGPDGKSEAHRLVEGDLWRVPEMAVHWTWNRSGQDCELVEFHSPGLQADPGLGAHSTPLFGDNEPHTVMANPKNIFIRPDDVPLEEMEATLPAPLTV